MSNTHTPVEQSLVENWSAHVDDLISLARIPSVSFPGFPKEKVVESAEAVARLLTERGLENVEILRIGDAHPYVYGEWMGAPGQPTLLLYAHHDVQPPGREPMWKTPPFEPTRAAGPGGERLYGRGTADDKAGIIVHTAAISSYLKTEGKLPVNVKVLIEGEEEIGSTHLEKFLTTYREKLQADVLVLTDTANFDCGVPALTIALRGLVGVEVELRGLNKTIHSGMWGGPVPDAAVALSKMLGGLLDENGKIAVPEIAAMVPPLTEEESRELAKLDFPDERFKEASGMVAGAEILKQGPSPIAQTWRFPSLTVNAVQASSRAQANNIINDVAWAKVTVRVAAGMDSKKVQQALMAHLQKQVPWGLELKLTPEECANPWATKPEGPAFDGARRALEAGYGVKPVMMGCGGSIPFVTPFARALGGAPALLIGVEDPYTNAHGENESLLIDDLKKACLSQIRLFRELSRKA